IVYLFVLFVSFFFFFQAEDGIRDDLVTGVQTCALPISQQHAAPRMAARPPVETRPAPCSSGLSGPEWAVPPAHSGPKWPLNGGEIGRASCRERGEMAVVDGEVERKTEENGTRERHTGR